MTARLQRQQQADPLLPSDRALLAIQRRIEWIRTQDGEQRAARIAVGVLLLIDWYCRVMRDNANTE